jgi:hypothetical protein
MRQLNCLLQPLALTAGLLSAAPTAGAPVNCTDQVRIVGIPPANVLGMRETPWVPGPGERSNLKLGVPPSARDIEDLGQQFGEWRKIRFRGVDGWVRTRFLRPNGRRCEQVKGQPVNTAPAARRIDAALRVDGERVKTID